MKRRDFLRLATSAISTSYVSSAFIPGLSSLQPVAVNNVPKRLVIVFSPNGMVADGFWPEREGTDFDLTKVLTPLESFREKMLVVHGICNLVRGDGDSHMRGMSCLLTSNELFPGNIVGGSDSPAGWSRGISIDQEIKNWLQSNEATKTRFGSLEFGVRVPDEANPWTRMVYAGANEPIAPISNPYDMYSRIYGKLATKDTMLDVLNLVDRDFDSQNIDRDRRDAAMLMQHRKHVGKMKADLNSVDGKLNVPALKLPANVVDSDENMPELSKMQMDLLVNSFANDFNRIATLQYTKSVGNARMKWLDVKEGHHGLSHKPDKDKKAQESLTRINTWYAEQIAYLAKQLSETKEPGTDQSMLDNTLIIWTNELGHGNSHTLNNLPFVMVGGGFGFDMGRYVKVDRVSTDQVWRSVAHSMGHHLETFGSSKLPKSKPVDFG
jgi:hypothetical protein